MGLLFSYLGYYGRTDDPDPITGLTSRDKYLIRTNWAIVRKDMTNVGVLIFYEFFKEFPEYQNYFSAFKDTQLEDIPKNKKLRAHAANVMYSFTSLVDNLDDNDVLVNLVARLGESHARQRIPEKAVFDIRKAILAPLVKYLGSNLTSEGVTAFEKMVDVVLKGIVSNLHTNE